MWRWQWWWGECRGSGVWVVGLDVPVVSVVRVLVKAVVRWWGMHGGGVSGGYG